MGPLYGPAAPTGPHPPPPRLLFPKADPALPRHSDKMEVTAEELAQHRSLMDMWVRIGAKVYDLSDYALLHPGGASVLMDVAGKDATLEFEAIEHSDVAKETMERYCIGTFVKEKEEVKEAPPTSTGEIHKRKKEPLAPGHSPMDWVRIMNSRAVPQQSTYTMEQVAQHNTADDAWLVLHSIVYDVTQYLPFHPGGHSELMRGVGRDATALFSMPHRALLTL